jgi:hypothetical protein
VTVTYLSLHVTLTSYVTELQKQQEDVELKNHYIALLNADLSKSEEGYWIDKDWLKGE